jgi:hypothetical protein
VADENFICCTLLGSEPGFGWGCKHITESMGPAYYSCPLSYLDMAPVRSPEWREQVRRYHAPRLQRLRIGQTVNLRPNSTGHRHGKVIRLRPLLMDIGGFPCKVPRSLLALPNQGRA